MHDALAPPALTPAEYARLLCSVSFWAPYVREVCRRHRQPCHSVLPGVAGTYPTFVVDGRCVVKLFGEFYDGAVNFLTERYTYEHLAATPLPVPRLLAEGRLFPAEGCRSWSYLVCTCLPGEPLANVLPAMDEADKARLAEELGRVVRCIHRLPVAGTEPLPTARSDWAAFLRARRSRCLADHEVWHDLPEGLAADIVDYLPGAERLLKCCGVPRVLHGDITADHVLLRHSSGWRLSGLIDFGDARLGSPLYDLVALHLDALRCDKMLLARFLDAHGRAASDVPGGLAQCAMSFTLLREFDVLGPVFHRRPDAGQVSGLQELATVLWDLDAPGSV